MLQQNNEHNNYQTSYSMIERDKNLGHQNIQKQNQNTKQLNSYNNKHINTKDIKNKKHTQDQGFAFQHEEQNEVVFVKKQQPIGDLINLSKKFIPYRIKQPKLKLTFLAQKKQQQCLTSKIKNQNHIKSLQIKKSTPSNLKMPSLNDIESMVQNCVVKINRNFVGDNIQCHNHSLEQSKKIKFEIISSGNRLIYQYNRQSSTYAQISLLKQKTNKIRNQHNNKILDKINSNKPNQIYINSSLSTNDIRNFQKHSKSIQNERNFLDYAQNELLKKKLKQSFVQHRYRQINNGGKEKNINEGQLVFDAQFQSANLSFVSKKTNLQSLQQTLHSTTKGLFKTQSIQQYNLYLRNDTNTHGHQNWFYFRVKNVFKTKKRIKFNICNLKRNLNLIKDGQKIYSRIIYPQKTQWQCSGENIEMKQSKKDSIYRGKIRSLSFQLDLNGQTQYQISLLPPYTYSQLMQDIEKIKFKPNVKVQTLTYSLIGLAVPLITFTNFNSEQNNKQVILISSRIHPGQTVASFMVKGFIQALSDIENPQIQQFLNTTIVKIVPMINPDGVVFGNFRTNYLGYDLNRSFHSQDEITNPQVLALKQLGKKLKHIHGDKFSIFIDLHGHSSEKNIFTYGPDYENGNQKFYKARLLPKLLNSKSPYFRYSSCSFKLQQYKINTARGFFLNTLNVISFTIQSSYAIYQNYDGKNQLLTHKQWISFGSTLYSSFQLMQRLNKNQNIKNRTQLKRVISLTEEQNLSIMSALKKQIKKQQKANNKIKRLVEKQEDSDGEDQTQDLNINQRQEIEKKLVENSIRNIVLPKVFKPSILYPTVTPKLFHIGQNATSSYKILYTRKNRYQSIKLPVNDYLHSIQGLQQLNLKPKARNIRLDRKIQF